MSNHHVKAKASLCNVGPRTVCDPPTLWHGKVIWSGHGTEEIEVRQIIYSAAMNVLWRVYRLDRLLIINREYWGRMTYLTEERHERRPFDLLCSSNNLAVLGLLLLVDLGINANKIRILWEYKVFLLLFARLLFAANVYNEVHRSKLQCAQSLLPLLQVQIVQYATSYCYAPV